MLKDLGDYAIKNDLVSIPGFAPKKIKAYIFLNDQGQLIGMEPGGDEPILCPDFGNETLGGKIRHFLADSLQYVINVPSDKKQMLKIKANHEFFINMLKEASAVEPQLSLCEKALSNETTLEKIRELCKLYPLSRTNFKIEYRDFGHFRKLRPHIVDKPKIEVRHLVVSGS